MDATEAAACGFVTSIVAPTELDAHADALCKRLLAHAPITMRVTKETIRRVLGGLADDDDLLRAVYGSRDFSEGVDAFLSKRQPRWEGR
jgi:enoyl-CoA hydratase/carnithine racemase